MSRTTSLAAMMAAAALVAAGPAAAAPTLQPKRCERGLPQGTRCSTLTVPLDRGGAVPGNVELPVRVVRARGDGARRGPLILLSGGPGQAGLSPAPYLEAVVSWAPGYDVVELDQRGTGATALTCKAFTGVDEDADTSPAELSRLFAACAEELGPKRRFYTSADSAADLDDLRAALGAEQLTLGGTSYGTWVSQVYARLYPQRVARLVLDSVVGPTGVAGIALSEYAGARRIVAEQCAGGACRGITDDPLGDTTRLAARLDAEPLRGRVVGPSGRSSSKTVGGPRQPGVLSGLFYAGDHAPQLRAGFPAAVSSALQGDPALLLRLHAASSAEEPEAAPDAYSSALYAATTCAESVLPWTGTDPFDQRLVKLDAALAALPPGELGPWGASAAAASPVIAGCRLWPDSPSSGTPAGALPDVPALVLNGLADVRTPVEDARAVAALLSRATVVEIPNQGHSVLAQACARGALKRFLADRPVAADVCAGVPAGPERMPVPPRALSAVAPRGAGRRALARRSIVAARAAVRDAGAMTALYDEAPRFPGLRGGTARLWEADGSYGLAMKDYVYVPGMRVSGRLDFTLPVSGRLVVRGPKVARGTLLVRGGTARGRLGGVPVTLRIQRDRPR